MRFDHSALPVPPMPAVKPAHFQLTNPNMRKSYILSTVCCLTPDPRTKLSRWPQNPFRRFFTATSDWSTRFTLLSVSCKQFDGSAFQDQQYDALYLGQAVHTTFKLFNVHTAVLGNFSTKNILKSSQQILYILCELGKKRAPDISSFCQEVFPVPSSRGAVLEL